MSLRNRYSVISDRPNSITDLSIFSDELFSEILEVGLQLSMGVEEPRPDRAL